MQLLDYDGLKTKGIPYSRPHLWRLMKAKAFTKQQALDYPVAQIFDGYRRDIDITIKPPVKALITATRDANARNKQARASLIQPEKAVDPIRAAIKLQMLATKRTPQIIELMHGDASGETAAIVFDNWATLGFPEAMRSEIETSTGRLLLQAKFARNAARRQPTWDDILADGPDEAFAEKLASDALKGMENNEAEVITTRNWISEAVQHIGVAANAMPSGVFTALMS